MKTDKAGVWNFMPEGDKIDFLQRIFVPLSPALLNGSFFGE
jgi:hypothetical protein